jgi:hypothetical protein
MSKVEERREQEKLRRVVDEVKRMMGRPVTSMTYPTDVAIARKLIEMRRRKKKA